MMLRNWARLYTRPTAAEISLEPAIAALGERYRAQHPFFGLYLIADFVLLDRRVIIEVDGDSHNTLAQRRKDLQHMIALEEQGWAVVRMSNAEAISDPYGALEWALSRVPSRPSKSRLVEMLEALPPEENPRRLRKSARTPRSNHAGRKPRRSARGPREPVPN